MNIIRNHCLKIFKNGFTNQSHIRGLGRLCSYKSAFSLENLYPNSNLKLCTPAFVPEEPTAEFSGYIPMKELKITYSCSPGPGGQNVNKVHTKVDLRFNVKDATWISNKIKDALLTKEKNRINKDGYLIIKSDLTRSQHLNLADALEKLRTMIRSNIVHKTEPSVETTEKWRRAERKAAQSRIYVKRARSDVKQNRRGPDVCDF